MVLQSARQILHKNNPDPVHTYNLLNYVLAYIKDVVQYTR